MIEIPMRLRQQSEHVSFDLKNPTLRGWLLILLPLMIVTPTLGSPTSQGNWVAVLSVGAQASLPDALGAFYAHPVKPGEVVVMWLGNDAPSGILLKTVEKVVLIDPASIISGDDVQRLQRLDILLITHEHTDHFLTPATISIQSKTGAVVVVNPGAFDQLKGFVPLEKLFWMKSGETRTLSGIEIRAIAAIHPGSVPLTYILAVGDISVFHGSDSGFNGALDDYRGKAKLALVPTGDPSPTASPEDALKMVKALEPSDVIPMHGTEHQMSRLGILLAEQTPNVKYHPPQGFSSLVVDEFSKIGFVAFLASVAGFAGAFTSRLRKPILWH